MLVWSKWLNVDHFNSIGKKPGVYKIRLAHSGNHHSALISRLLGKDKCGLLSIGHSVNVSNRIQNFYRVAGKMPGFFKHSAGDRLFLAQICARATSNTYFSNKIIQFSSILVQSKEEAKELEERLLKCYFKKYGELPPLNSSMPDGNVQIWDETLLARCE